MKKNSEKETESKVILDFRMHSIILLLGPSGCGKTYFTKNKLIPSLKSYDGVSVSHLSSDDIRRELLGDESLSKRDNKMLYSSKQAFNLLDAKLKALTSYPVNSNFVIVDSTGLNKDFRDSIKEVAKQNNYNLSVIIFDYKGREPYYNYITDEESKVVTSRQLKYMRENVMREVSKKEFRDIHKIKTRNIDEYCVKISDYEEYSECLLSSDLDYVIIGDIHGCYKEFIALLEKNGFEIKSNKITHEDSSKKIILLGDLVDKGYDVRNVIELVHANSDIFYSVKGNHENFVYRYLKGGMSAKDLPPQDVIDEYFDSIKLFESDEDLKEKFFEVCESMKPFLLHEDFIATHAPCDEKYLGKLDTSSKRNQRTIVYPKSADYDNPQEYIEAKTDFFKFFREQASRSLPYHVFGHVTTAGVSVLKNKINIDSGAVSGGHLSSIIINPKGRNLIQKVPQISDKIVKKNLDNFFQKPTQKITIDNIEGRDKGRILTAAENKVNFISGTICPADKKLIYDDKNNFIIEDSELESLDKAIEYFKNKGVKKVVAQPKYMGSRANIYLFKDPKNNYTTSRGGHVIKPTHIDLTNAYKPLYEIPYIKKAFSKNTKLIILDAELLPWSAIGKGLIDKDFITLDKAISSEIEFLKTTGFEDVFSEFINGKYKESNFEEISQKTSRKELIKKLGSNDEKTFRSIKQFKDEFIYLEDMIEMSKVYSKQIELYGSGGEVHFKPFSILKEVFLDDTEKLFFDSSNAEIYSAINSDNYVVVDLNNQEEIEVLKQFYDKTTIDEDMEGIMLKPLKVYVEGVAPSIKVRNPRYLTIIYGPDYLYSSKFSKLINRKKVRRKLELSVKEWELGKRILEIPYRLINKENKHFIQAYGEMVLEEKFERELDPRL